MTSSVLAAITKCNIMYLLSFHIQIHQNTGNIIQKNFIAIQIVVTFFACPGVTFSSFFMLHHGKMQPGCID